MLSVPAPSAHLENTVTASGNTITEQCMAYISFQHSNLLICQGTLHKKAPLIALMR